MTPPDASADEAIERVARLLRDVAREYDDRSDLPEFDKLHPETRARFRAMAADALRATPPGDGATGEAEALAQRFHEAYERLAPSFGYETRRESAKPWGEVPEQNRRLMVAVCAELLAALPPARAATPGEDMRRRSG